MSWGTWIERQPKGNVTRSWMTGVAWGGKYGNGETIISVAVDADYLHISNDGGATWSDGRGSGYGLNSLSASDDGAHIIAGTLYGRVYISSDSGVSWTKVLDPGWSQRTGVASSSDGKNLAAVIVNGGTYLSHDYGASWSNPDPHIETTAVSIACDIDMEHLIVGGATGRIYLSSDSGVSWTTITPAGESTGWERVAMNADGTVLMAAEDNGYVWFSKDSGGTWDSTATWDADEEHYPMGHRSWKGCAVSDDGQRMFISGYKWFTGGSQDGGTTWVHYDWPESVSSGYVRVAISRNGEYVLAGSATSGRLYTMGQILQPPHSFPWLGRFQLSRVPT
jgi:photosystem II stability/assembly factor-like uncharacterized protein